VEPAGSPAVEPRVEIGAAEPEMAVDPVCGMEVDPADAAATASVDGVTHYFCSTGCRDHFLADQRRPAS
jgi:YHS domain-containing protein